MTPRDYRESWAWVHLFLNGSRPGKSVLLAALGGLNEKPGKLGLTEKGRDQRTLARPPEHLQSLPTHVESSGDDNTVRLQDKALTRAPTQPPPARAQILAPPSRMGGDVGLIAASPESGRSWRPG